MSKVEKTCLVLMPFHTKFKEVYEQVYKPVCESKNIFCWRIDELKSTGSITRDIIEGIIEADLIIADLSEQNPNVFYELGIAHAISNKTIMTSQDIKYVPFDIANYRIILYEQTISGSKKLIEGLSETIDALLKAMQRTNNPVQDVLHKSTVISENRRMPILKALPIGNWPSSIRKYLLEEKGYIYVDELLNMDFDVLIKIPGIGKTSLEHLFYSLLQLELPEKHLRKINEFVVKNHIDISYKNYWKYF